MVSVCMDSRLEMILLNEKIRLCALKNIIITYKGAIRLSRSNMLILKRKPCWVGLVVSVSASHTVGHEFASLGHTKDHHKNGTNCLPSWHAMR